MASAQRLLLNFTYKLYCSLQEQHELCMLKWFGIFIVTSILKCVNWCLPSNRSSRPTKTTNVTTHMKERCCFRQAIGLNSN